MLRFDLDGLSRYLNKTAKNTNLTVARALKDEAQDTLTATIPVTPIEFGPLRASGRTSPAAIVGGGTIVVDITFGGPAAGYAVYVHERVYARDRNGKVTKKVFHAPPTKAKFLSETAESRFSRTQAGVYARTLMMFRKG